MSTGITSFVKRKLSLSNLRPDQLENIQKSVMSTSSTSSPAATSPKPSGESMQDLIPVVNRLMDVFHTIHYSDGLDLPQIVVVGSQSAGKSSVLENIVHKDFLPRGKDIVTRRPLILQLINLKSGEHEFAEFLHLPSQKFVDFELVRAEIERETERVAGGNKGVSKIPIHLKISSPHVLNLTLVDLPGLTKIPIGDQPPDIEMKIRKLVFEFVSKPNSVILAVTPANQDIVNSDALKLAREVDPEGKRTIGVLTKLDLMDNGTNAYDILTNRAFPLRLGFIGLVNRSQQDIIENKPIDSSLNAEQDFFRNHHAYRSISQKCGTAFLAKTLNSILMHHIRERLPDLKARLNLAIVQAEQELASYGDAIFTGKAHQGSLVLRLLTKFAANFNSSIDGTYADISTSELCGGARLYYIFNSIFGETLGKIDPCTGLSVNDIRTAIRNSTGPRPSLFIPELAFDLLVKPQLRRLEGPSLRCVELVFDELLKIVNSCETKELSRFPKLHHRVVEVVVELLRERMAPTQAYIESLISIQLAYINTNHPDFLGGNGAISMMERKHDKRRRDIEKLRRNQNSLSAHLPNAPAGLKDMSALADDLPFTSGSKPKDIPINNHSHHNNGPHGRDSGFLTYFFGNHPSGSPESRSTSPVRGNPATTSSVAETTPQELAVDYDDHISSPFTTSAPSYATAPPPALSEKEEMEVELIRSLISSYFNITKKAIADLVPKTIMYLIVNFAKENVQNKLVTSLYREDLFAELLMEDDKVMREREKCKEILEVYKKGAIILQDIF